ncbi:MAG: carboxylate--amine ligase [Spirochaetes bacterium]|nr:MAG: carboxylate--amine ligase [Spirochaetota bacterium]
MQIPSIRIARRKGLRVVVADGNPGAPGAGMADEFLHVDLKDKERLAEEAKIIARNGGLQGVFTAGTDFSTTVAWISEKIGLPGIPYSVALNATDKSRMRRIFKEKGIPSPEFAVVDSDKSLVERGEKIGFPMVVKPVDNMGARGVRRVDTLEDLKEAFTLAKGNSGSGRVILEEYIPGPEFSLDAIVSGGDIFICGIADRHICFSPFFVEMGHTMPSNYPEDVKDRVIRVFRDGVRALGITDGAAKGDIKLSPSGPVIGEIAARLSGGYMSGWTYPYSSGVEVTEAAMNIAMGLPLPDLKPRQNLVSAERAFISIPGTVESILGVEKTEEEAGVKDVFLRVSPGNRVFFPTNNVEKCGNIITQAKTREEAIEIGEKGLSHIVIRLKPLSEETADFLFRDKLAWVPTAFKLTRKANLEVLNSLPVVSGSTISNEKIYIFKLPELHLEDCREWHGRTLRHAFYQVCDLGGAEALDPCSEEKCMVLGKLFWKAFLRGGVQGGLWVIDTVRSLFRVGKNLTEVVRLWEV